VHRATGARIVVGGAPLLSTLCGIPSSTLLYVILIVRILNHNHGAAANTTTLWHCL